MPCLPPRLPSLPKAPTNPKAPNGKGGEICFTVDSSDAVRAAHADWSKRMPIAQAPTEMDFGHTFVALDPDGYRLRVFSPSQR